MSIELNVIDDQPVSLETSGEQISLRSTTPQVDGVISVNGKQGVVVLTAEDIGVTGVPSNVRQAMLTLFESAAYATTGLTDEIAVIESWAEQVTSLSVSPTTLSLNGSTPQSIVATVVPSGSTVTWSSSDTSIATVVGGVVTGVANGSCTITASAGDLSATCEVTVAGFATLSSISAVYTQSGTVYDTDSLDSLKADLVVTATYSDSTTATVPSTDYTLSGTLAVGTSVITVAYGGKTTTFNVTVAPAVYAMDNGKFNYSGTSGGINYTGRYIEVTNYNHVHYYNPNTGGTGSAGSFTIIDALESNALIPDSSNTTTDTIFTLPANSSVRLILTNIMWNNVRTGSSTSTSVAVALRQGTTAIVSTGAIYNDETSKTVTADITNATPINCVFGYFGGSVGDVEFDIKVVVNGERWI